MATKKQLESEVSGYTTFEYKGVEYTVTNDRNKLPLDAVEAFEEGKIAGFVKHLIGPAKYKELRKTAKTLEDLDEFVDVLNEKAFGLDPKE